jgi:hypothetical protein
MVGVGVGRGVPRGLGEGEAVTTGVGLGDAEADGGSVMRGPGTLAIWATTCEMP